MNHVMIDGMSWLRPWRVLAVVVAALIAAPLEAAIQSTEAAAQVWKPRSRQKPRAKGTAVKAKPAAGKAKAKLPPKKSRKASSKAKAARTKAPAASKPSKKNAKKARRAPRGDDDFTIIEEDYPDED